MAVTGRPLLLGWVLEEAGLEGAATFCIAAATYGLIAGGLVGGPLGDRLIRRKKLLKTVSNEEGCSLMKADERTEYSLDNLAPAVFQLILAAGIGTVISWALSKIGLRFPIYVGAMIMAAVMRNISEYTGAFTIRMDGINTMSSIFLNLFLGIAMLTLKLWQLAGLALPLMILLAVQTAGMLFYARFVVFNVMGHDYDAAVISAGTCGLGLGASPTAMANMQTICKRYIPSARAFLIVPVVGGIILDFINSLFITFFINMIG